MEDLQLVDYLSILRRGKKLFALVAGGVFLLALLVTLSWSNYRATATVEVTEPEIPETITTRDNQRASDIVRDLTDLRISRLQQKVMATGSLVEIITKFDLYADSRLKSPMADLAEKMRKKIKIDLVGTSLANPSAAQKASADQLAAIAFTVSFDYSDPLVSQQVTNYLVSRFIEEDLKERRGQAKETSSFLDAQIKVLEESLKDQEEQIAHFRMEHGDTRPEALAFNQQAATSIMMNLQNLESQMTANLGSQGALRAQLASTEPYSRVLAEGQILTTPDIQLKTLRSNFASLSAKYGPTHPDVLKAKRQIDQLEAQAGLEKNSDSSAALQATIGDTRARLETALKTYGSANPDVVSLRNQLGKLEKQLAQQNVLAGKAGGNVKADADNPAYLAILAQIKTLEEQYAAMTQQKTKLQGEQAKYQGAVKQNPATEQKLAELTRNYANTEASYRDLKAKKISADMSASIDEGRSGQRLALIDPPELPSKTQPSRLLFLIGGVFLSVASGLSAVLLRQFLRDSIVGALHVENLIGAAPLVIVPHLVNEADIERRKKNKVKIALFLAVAFLLFLALFSYLVMPLDVLLSVIGRKFGFAS